MKQQHQCLVIYSSAVIAVLAIIFVTIGSAIWFMQTNSQYQASNELSQTPPPFCKHRVWGVCNKYRNN